MRRLSRRLGLLAPVLAFAGILALIQWVSGMPVTGLGLKTVAVCLVTIAAVQAVPWRRWTRTARPGSLLYTVVLLGLFSRHFAAILIQESRRVLTARSLAVPKSRGPGSFRSLVHAAVSLLDRSLRRAERFYAAQWLRGIAE
jgi:hypothetical protein